MSVRFSNPTVPSPEKSDLTSVLPLHTATPWTRELSAFQLMSTVIMLHYGFFPNANATVTGEIWFFTFNQKVVRECG